MRKLLKLFKAKILMVSILTVVYMLGALGFFVSYLNNEPLPNGFNLALSFYFIIEGLKTFTDWFMCKEFSK